MRYRGTFLIMEYLILIISIFLIILWIYLCVNTNISDKFIASNPYEIKRKVSEITTKMLRKELSYDKQLLFWLRDSECFFGDLKSEMAKEHELYHEKLNEEYWHKHHKIHVRLSIKQTKI